MDNLKQIAIIIPIYNAEKYISDCLESILAQTYPYWRAYCINDGSKDHTAAILDEYAKKDTRIRVFHKANTGAASTRNFGLKKIENEEWISFIDADDYIGITMFESIFKAIGNNNIDYVRLFCCHTSNRYNPSIVNKENSDDINYNIVSSDEYFIRGNVGGYICSLFVRKSIVDNYKITFPENMVTLEDQVFSITCAIHANNILILESPRNYFYYSGNNCSITKKTKDSSNDIIRCLNIVYKTFIATGKINIINDYFYRKYLPIKLDILYGCRLHNIHTKPTEKIIPEIKIRLTSLSYKAKFKYLIVKILRLL